MRFMTKMRQDNDVISHTGPLYPKNKTELSWPIRQDTVYDEDQTGQQRDWWYKCGV